MDPLNLFKLLLRHKWLIIGLSILAGIITFILISQKRNSYESVAQYATGFTTEKVKLTDGTIAIDVYTLDIKFNNVIETFQSPKVIGILSYKLLLHDLQNPNKKFKADKPGKKEQALIATIGKNKIIDLLQSRIADNDVLNSTDATELKIIELLKLYEYDEHSLRKMLEIKRMGRTDYVNIICTSENPNLSAFMVNTIGAQFINYYSNLNKVKTTESADQIEKIFNIQKLKVDSLTNELKLARISQGALDPVEKTKNSMEMVKDLQVEFSNAQREYNLHSRLYESYVQQIGSLKSISSAVSGSTNTMELFAKRDRLREAIARGEGNTSDLQNQLARIESQINNHSSNAGDKNKYASQIEALESQAAESKARMQAASTTMRQLGAAMGTAKSAGAISPRTQVEIDAIERQLDIENNELKNIREKYSLAEGMIIENPTADFRQTLVGQPGMEPLPKRRLLSSGLAMISTAVLVSLILLLSAIFDSAIGAPSRFKEVFNTNLLSSLNAINLKKNSLSDTLLNVPGYNATLFVSGLNKLRSRLEESGSKSILVTSLNKKTGKSLLIESLAYTLARMGKKVIMVDMNFENNYLTRKFNAIEAIKPEADIAANGNFHNSISPTNYDQIQILGCATGRFSPAEIFDPEFYASLFQFLKNHYDYILVETADLNNKSDAYELHQWIEKELMVFSAKEKPSVADIEIMNEIKQEPKYMGAILNLVNPENLKN